jgi:PAS domain S-box-containing protein
MKIYTLQKLRKLFAILVAAVGVVLLVVTLFVVHTLHESKLRYYANAEETSRNLAITLDNFLHAHFQEVDLALRRARAEFLDRQGEHRFDPAGYSAFLRSLKERLPQAQAVRGSDAEGNVIYGDEIDPAHIQNLQIRDFFQQVRSQRELVFGTPVRSRITGQWVFPVLLALTQPDGSFGGTAYVNMGVSRVTEVFSSLGVGEHGSIALFDKDKHLLQRYPVAPDLKLGEVMKVSKETAAMLASGASRATYNAISVRDGKERVVSVDQIGNYPIFVAVGLSSEDFLTPWRREVRNATLFLVLLGVMSGLLLLGVWISLQRQYDALTLLVESDNALKDSVGALRESESRWRSLTEGLPQMVWTASPQVRVDYLSHHWTEFSGIPAGELLAPGGWSRILHPDDSAAVQEAWRRALEETGTFRCDARLRRSDGSWRLFDHHALPQKDAAGAILGWVGSSTDITEARAAHDALIEAKEAAVKAGRAKSEFVANMSHEIRSPMNAVLGMLQLLQQTRMDERQRDYAGKAESAARALLGLLNDILDFSKVEAGKLALDPHPFRLDKLWRDLAVILSANVGAKDIELLFRIDPELPALVVGDALRLQQILLNLAGNAIKFTEHGEVVVSAQLVAQTERSLSVLFAIRDTGIGISDEQCSRIFNGFSQAEASTARRYGGTGLGLAISQRLVKLMGGALRVTSEPGQGSVFDFTVDFQRADMADRAADMAALPASLRRGDAPAQMRNLSCLVVDDNAAARTILSEMVSSFGWQVETAEDGVQALNAVMQHVGRHQPYDVIFIDWRMPQLDGWETSRRIREQAPAGNMPLIVMVTAHDRELLAQRQKDMAAVLDGFVVKPVTASSLFDAVAAARLEQRLPELEPAPLPVRRLEGVRLLLVDDNPANQQVASELLGAVGAQVEVANSGAMAIGAVSRGGALPDLILMDIQMPEMDGYQACAAILALLGGRAPPIVAMTANVLPSDRAAALESGMVDHIGKPFELGELVDVIRQHARRDGVPLEALLDAGVAAGSSGASPSRLTPSAAPVSRVPDQTPELNSAAALRRMGGLTAVYLVALRSFQGEVDALAAQLKAASAAGDEAFALRALHTLKGLAGTVGADHLSALTAEAERAFKQGPVTQSWPALAIVVEACAPAASQVRQMIQSLDPATT